MRNQRYGGNRRGLSAYNLDAVKARQSILNFERSNRNLGYTGIFSSIIARQMRMQDVVGSEDNLNELHASHDLRLQDALQNLKASY